MLKISANIDYRFVIDNFSTLPAPPPPNPPPPPQSPLLVMALHHTCYTETSRNVFEPETERFLNCASKVLLVAELIPPTFTAPYSI